MTQSIQTLLPGSTPITFNGDSTTGTNNNPTRLLPYFLTVLFMPILCTCFLFFLSLLFPCTGRVVHVHEPSSPLTVFTEKCVYSAVSIDTETRESVYAGSYTALTGPPEIFLPGKGKKKQHVLHAILKIIVALVGDNNIYSFK
jgi:hypothetical protein